MDEEQGSYGCWGTFKTLVSLVLVAFVLILAVTIFGQTGNATLAVLLGSFCTLGMIGTVTMLLVLVRQSHVD